MEEEKDQKEIKEEIIVKKEETKLDFKNIFWICIIGSVIGVVVETVYCYLTRGVIESRAGLMYGPFNLVYGIGAVLITVVLYKFRDKSEAYIFVIGMLVGASFEFLCSLFQEISFGTISWRYDEGLFNFGGRINLMYSIFWGVLSIVWFRLILNPLIKFLSKIPKKTYKYITYTMLVFMIFNSYISYVSVDRMSRRKNDPKQYRLMDELLDKHYPDDKVKKVYPNMWYVE